MEGGVAGGNSTVIFYHILVSREKLLKEKDYTLPASIVFVLIASKMHSCTFVIFAGQEVGTVNILSVLPTRGGT